MDESLVWMSFKDFRSIADAAMVSNPAVERIRATGMHWRLCPRFKLCHDMKEQAWAQAATEGEAGGSLAARRAPVAIYQAQTFEAIFAGVPPECSSIIPRPWISRRNTS